MANSWGAYMWAQAAAEAALRQRMAAYSPPRQWAEKEVLVVYCCGHGKDLVVVPQHDPRVAGNRQMLHLSAYYKE
jgi:hypothetical protein